MQKLVEFVLKALPFIYMALIWTLSSMPADAVVEFNVYDGLIKESLHLVEFAILYLLFVLFFLVDGKLTIKTNLIAAVIACLWGLTDEIHQSFVPARSATVIDLVKDVTGVAVCYWIVYRSYLRSSQNKLGKMMVAIEKMFVKR